MKEFKYTFKEVSDMTPEQIEFLMRGLERENKERKREMDKARRRRR